MMEFNLWSIEMKSVTEIFNKLQSGEGVSFPSFDIKKLGDSIKSPEEIRADWLKLRLGKFTASEFHRLMAYQGKPELPKGGQTYAIEKAIELMTAAQPDSYISPAMAWGIEHEADAIQAFMEATGLEVSNHGHRQVFLQMGPDIGGTADGLIPKISSGVEVKCPNSKTHLDYMEINDAVSLKAIKPEYYWQCQGLMKINMCHAFWYFASYDPRFKVPALRLHIAKIERNDSDIEDLMDRLAMAIKYRDEFVLAKTKKAG